MYECMLKSENSKLSMLVTMSQDDCLLYAICKNVNNGQINTFES